MGRKRKPEEEKKVTFHLSIKKKVIDEFKKELERREEVPSRMLEKLIIDFLKKK